MPADVAGGTFALNGDASLSLHPANETAAEMATAATQR